MSRSVFDPKFVEVGDRIIGSSRWREHDGRIRERLMVITFRDGKIVDMQGFASRRAAERFAKVASSSASAEGSEDTGSP